MTNREKYKQAFSALQASERISLEVENMAIISQKRRKNYIAAGLAACMVLVTGAAMVYAADLGGIQRTVQVWVHGDQTTAVMEFNEEDGSYYIKYPDDQGAEVEERGGGVAIEEDGSERPLTEEELMEQINAPDLEYGDDGTVKFYYMDQVMDITDQFEDGVCYLQLKVGDTVQYVTIPYGQGYAMSPSRYLDPKEFNAGE